LISRIETAAPAYMHSFAMTKKYAILCEHPLRLSSPELIFSGKPYIKCYHWQDQMLSNFIVVSKESGDVVRRFEAASGFSFHQINAFDRENEIVLDLVTYPDAQVIEVLYLQNMLQDKPELVGQASRFCLNLDNGKLTVAPLTKSGLEFPQISYRSRGGKNYNYCYGSGTTGLMADNCTSTDFLNALRKIEVNTGTTKVWHEDGCYPGEPVFVPRADSTVKSEDDGVLLSVVLDVPNERSFLLVLDAGTMQEMARMGLPQPVPFTFHGVFVGAPLS
jgi:carotenoid cleavage dioxygenase-like enzyme